MFLQLDSSVTLALVWAHMGGDWDHMSDHMGGWAWGFAWLFVILLVVLVVALVAWAVRSVSRGGSARSGRNGAVAVLEERFARGELSPEEYRERRRVLDER
ncbi:MAG TPA: SHOCT domain-containing protein [Acidimicrobiia bacterium]